MDVQKARKTAPHDISRITAAFMRSRAAVSGTAATAIAIFSALGSAAKGVTFGSGRAAKTRLVTRLSQKSC